ncbi:hypothetical protein EDD17DRAFT_1512936 [Pisolithus thermaeus]|nr:hypothetical protein EDD17DRAFT_1512936 [Pisolithus thermaeus]
MLSNLHSLKRSGGSWPVWLWSLALRHRRLHECYTDCIDSLMNTESPYIDGLKHILDEVKSNQQYAYPSWLIRKRRVDHGEVPPKPSLDDPESYLEIDKTPGPEANACRLQSPHRTSQAFALSTPGALHVSRAQRHAQEDVTFEDGIQKTQSNLDMFPAQEDLKAKSRAQPSIGGE